MNIFIITMEDPVYTLAFIKDIIDKRKNDIVGLAVSKGNRLTINKKSKFVYIFSLLLIMGLSYFCKYSIITMNYRIKKFLSKYINIENPSIINYARKNGIKTYSINSPNSENFLKQIKTLKIDIVISQSQHILKKKIINIPSIGILNRHNALLPKNRGRLTPFWVLFNQDTETGVSIHFVEEGIDSGDIIVQEKFEISKRDTFNSIVKKNYQIALKAMLKALTRIETGDYQLIANDNSMATYNTTPTLKQAFQYRIRKFLLFNKTSLS